MYKTKKVAINAKRHNAILLSILCLVAGIRGRYLSGGNNIILKTADNNIVRENRISHWAYLSIHIMFGAVV